MNLEFQKVSLVIPTIGRGELLLKTLSHFLLSDYRDFEIVVVDQTPDPDDSVIKFMVENREKIKYIHIDKPGLPNARNVGIGEARGDIIVFVDDDVIPEKGFITAHASSYIDKIGGVAGRVLPPGNELGDCEDNPKKIAKIRFLGLMIFDNFDSLTRTTAHHARGCNMSFKREALIETGGFDVGFGGSAHMEETDISLRVRKLGYEMVFSPKASLVHLLEPVGGCRPKNMKEWFFWYGHNLCCFYRKNFPTYIFLLQCLSFVLKLPLQAIKRGNPMIIVWGLSGFLNAIFNGDIKRQ
jgi:GT2 family glycosyltransferase